VGKGIAEEKSRDFWDIISANRVLANSGHVMGGSFVFLFFSFYFVFAHTHTHGAGGMFFGDRRGGSLAVAVVLEVSWRG
jgi:hypothetical protein